MKIRILTDEKRSWGVVRLATLKKYNVDISTFSQHSRMYNSTVYLCTINDLPLLINVLKSVNRRVDIRPSKINRHIKIFPYIGQEPEAHLTDTSAVIKLKRPDIKLSHIDLFNF